MIFGKRQINLRSEMAIWAALKAMTLTLALTMLSVTSVTRYIESESHDDVAILANDVAQDFDHRMSQNFRMAEMAAGLDVLRDRMAPAEQKRAALANLQLTFPDCLWIGVVGMDGIVQVSGDGRLEGSSAKAQPWFTEGLRHPMISDLHQPDDVGLALMPMGEVDRVIDIARPLRDPLGNMIGVLNATISWKWALEFREMLLRNRNDAAGIEILVTDRRGRILIGPAAMIDETIGLAQETLSQHAAALGGMARGTAGGVFDTAESDSDSKSHLTNALRLTVTHWPDSGDYISAVGMGTGYQDFPGLGWNIVVRQPRDIAYAPAHQVRDRLITAGILMAILFAGIGWVIADRVTGSIRLLTSQARRLDRGERGIVLATKRGNREVAVLGETLNHMVDNLLQREQQLLDLNAHLETRIADRTALLAASNRQLEDEMAQRQAVENEREALIQQLRDQAEHDPLTGALNRRAFLAMAERDRRRLSRDNGRMAVIMFDIDHFKLVNDTYGHATGDEVIRAIVAAAAKIVRASDLLCRYGGEEFALLVPDPGAHYAASVAERLRLQVAALQFSKPVSAGNNPVDDPMFQVTISLGVTIAPAQSLREDGVTSLLDRADQALYAAKRGGRNRTMIDQQVINEFPPSGSVTPIGERPAETRPIAEKSATNEKPAPSSPAASARPESDVQPKTELMSDTAADREFATRFTKPQVANDG